MKIPSIHDIIIMLIGSNNEPFKGKTNIQKNLYLIKEMLSKKCELPISFKPHFYGPYSGSISNSLSLLEDSRIIKSYDEDILSGDDFEVKQTIYKLTPVGEKVFDDLKNEHREFYSTFMSNFQKIKDTGFHQNTQILSTAAKVKLILSMENEPLQDKTIEEKAKELGWKLNKKKINSAVKVLVETGLAKRVKN